MAVEPGAAELEQGVPTPEPVGPICLDEMEEDAEVSWVIGGEVEGQNW